MLFLAITILDSIIKQLNERNKENNVKLSKCTGCKRAPVSGSLGETVQMTFEDFTILSESIPHLAHSDKFCSTRRIEPQTKKKRATCFVLSHPTLFVIHFTWEDVVNEEN